MARKYIQIGIIQIIMVCLQIAVMLIAKVLMHIATIIHYQIHYVIHIWSNNIPICLIVNYILSRMFRLSNYMYINHYPFNMYPFPFDYYNKMILRKLPITKISTQNILRKLPLLWKLPVIFVINMLRKLPVIFVWCYENYLLRKCV